MKIWVVVVGVERQGGVDVLLSPFAFRKMTRKATKWFKSHQRDEVELPI